VLSAYLIRAFAGAFNTYSHEVHGIFIFLQ
jgi:hypothetical protein